MVVAKGDTFVEDRAASDIVAELREVAPIRADLHAKANGDHLGGWQ
jgi:hypothetical protein